VVVEFWFRACDRPDHAKKFKSLLTTGVWIEEASEVDPDVKRTLKGRIGRYPKLKKGEEFPLEFWLETSNPMEVEHEMFSMYKWIVEPPGVVPSKPPLADHDGFWQPPYENQSNLRPGYYDKLKERYRDSPEFYDMYVLGKPGSMVKGKLVYYDFTRDKHVGKETLTWHKGKLYRGWDNTGNHPACVVLQLVSPNKIHILKEFHHDRMGILDFTQWVVIECNQLFEGATYTDYADPAGENKISKQGGELTSNGEMMREFGVNVIPSEQNWETRREAVQKQIGIEGGLLVDPSCTRTINGFISGYAYAQIGTTGTYKDRPLKNRYCVDLETECLTVNGWKLYNETKENDNLPVYNLEKQGIEIGKILKVNVFPEKQDAIIFSSNEFEMVVTLSHECVVIKKISHRKTESKDTYTTYTPYYLESADKITTAHGFLSAAFEIRQKKQIYYSEWFIKLCAWVAAEGHYRKDGSILISQSHIHNSQYVESIDRLLSNERCLKSRNLDNDLITWRIVKELSILIRYVMPNKYPSMEFIFRMTNSQRRLFLYEFMRGDGDGMERGVYGPMPEVDNILRTRDFFRGQKTPSVSQRNGNVIDSLQIIATLAGMPSSKNERTDKYGKVYSLSFMKRRQCRWVCNTTKTYGTIDGSWCPTTTSGTWIARRKGRVFITGNSDIHDSIQYALVKIFRSETGRANAIKMARQQREHFKRLTIPGI